MKLLTTAALTLGMLASVAQAKSALVVENEAHLLNVNNIAMEFQGPRRGFDAYINVQFGNACMVPELDNIILSADYKRNKITYKLAAKSTGKICTMIFAPVEMTFVIPNIINPADGTPRITVNGFAPNNGQPVISGEVVELDQTYTATPLRVNEVFAFSLPRHTMDHNFIELNVSANSTFSNSCHVPNAADLYRIREQSLTGELNLTLVHKPEQIWACPAVYDPVMVTFDILRDAIISGPTKVSVNGVYAR